MNGMVLVLIVCLVIVAPAIIWIVAYRLGRRQERWAAMIAFRRIQKGPARGGRRIDRSHLN